MLVHPSQILSVLILRLGLSLFLNTYPSLEVVAMATFDAMETCGTNLPRHLCYCDSG